MAKKNQHHPPSSPAALISNKRRRIALADDSPASAVSATPSMPPTETSQPPASTAHTPVSSAAFAVPTVHIVTGSRIQAKVATALSTLSTGVTAESCSESAAEDSTAGGAVAAVGAGETVNHVVLLQAHAPAASKLVTVAEVVKRTLDEQGRPWWAYTGVKGGLEPFDPPKKRALSTQRLGGGSDAQAGEQSDGSAEEGEAFELLGRKHMSGVEKVRNVPVLLIYLATRPVPTLETTYGEKSSGS